MHNAPVSLGRMQIGYGLRALAGLAAAAWLLAGCVALPPAVEEVGLPAVLHLEAERAGGRRVQGSAVALGGDTAMTGCHVVEGATRVVVHAPRASFAARVVGEDRRRDLCRLEVPGLAAVPLPLRPAASLTQGEVVYAVGAPGGGPVSASEGTVLSMHLHDGIRLIRTDAAIARGSSGGGLFDAGGRLVGITTFLLRIRGEPYGFAVPVEDAGLAPAAGGRPHGHPPLGGH